jgi:hypothetical protein
VISVLEARHAGDVERAYLQYLGVCINPFGAAATAIVEGLEERARSSPGLPTPMPPTTGSESLKLLAKYREVKKAYDDSVNPETGRGKGDLRDEVNNIRAKAREMSCTVFSHLTRTNGEWGPINNMDIQACLAAHANAADASSSGTKDTPGTGTELIQEPPGGDPDGDEFGLLRRHDRSPAAASALARFQGTKSPTEERPPTRGPWLGLIPMAFVESFGPKLFAR